MGDLANTEFIMNNTFWVGVYPGMTNEKIDYMAKVIREAAKLDNYKNNIQSLLSNGV